MGEDNIKLTGGTLYFNGIRCSDASELVMDNIELSDENIHDILFPKPEPVEFTGTCRVNFRGLAVLIGFWPAVRWTVRGWWCKVKRLWQMLRTPIEED